MIDSTPPPAAPISAPAELIPLGCSDCGDGTYRNPVLFADYSDPDAIRVGEDYWLIASSFSHVPGLPILHSRDLVNWTLVNHALPRLVPDDHFSQPRHGAGVWAPTIRHHAGKFWIFYPDPDFGLYVITADDPRGSWSPPHLVKSGRGLIDPCPLWDERGHGFLIHGWAKSRAGVCNRLTLHRLAPDHRSVTDAGVVVIDGDQMPGWHTIEGPKLYQRSGYFYIFAPAGGVAEGYQAVFRARDIFGPYEARIVLTQGSTSVNGPHQGAWVDTPDGEHWFLHFQELPAYGRVVHLQPMRWTADDWPEMGESGHPVATHAKPRASSAALAAPATSDDFSRPLLGHQWQWQANPQPGWASLTARPGSLRLRCVPVAAAQTLWHAGHLLMQKFPAPAFVATVALEFFSAADGDTAGLVVFGYDYAWLGLRRNGSQLRLVLVARFETQAGAGEQELLSLAVPSVTIRLRVIVDPGARCHFAYANDGEPFVPIGPPFQARSSKWVGAKVGVFASCHAPGTNGGYADFARFEVQARASELAPGS